MKVLGMALIAVYSILMLLAVKKGSADKKAANGMLSGSILNLLAVGFAVAGSTAIATTLVIAGMVCISVGALLNGIAAKKVHIVHHIIRLALEAVMVWLFLAA